MLLTFVKYKDHPYHLSKKKSKLNVLLMLIKFKDLPSRLSKKFKLKVILTFIKYPNSLKS